MKQPNFMLNPESELGDASLLVVDEVSQVGDRMGQDLTSFDVRILVLGDPFQLPPVADGGYFINGEPDYLLTEVHRQAANSPVLEFATIVREGRPLQRCDRGASRVVPRGVLTTRDLADADQVIVGRNKSRAIINDKIRREVYGRSSHLPQAGDKLICTRNDGDLGLMNGGMWECVDAVDLGTNTIGLKIRDPDNGAQLTVPAHKAPFEGRDLDFWEVKEAAHFDFGYAITCHKAQGSQWGRVVVVDESHCFRQHSRRWLYTAITRAANDVVVVHG